MKYFRAHSGNLYAATDYGIIVRRKIKYKDLAGVIGEKLTYFRGSYITAEEYHLSKLPEQTLNSVISTKSTYEIY